MFQTPTEYNHNNLNLITSYFISQFPRFADIDWYYIDGQTSLWFRYETILDIKTANTYPDTMACSLFW